MAIVIGAGLAVAGAATQSLFRNPLVEPGLIGVSGGAALAAVCCISLYSSIPQELSAILGLYLLPVVAFLGGLLAVWCVYKIAVYRGRASAITLILAGVAINAFCGAAIGFILYFSGDAALRTYTFWTFGSFQGISWQMLIVALLGVVLPVIGILFKSGALNAMALGEDVAFHVGKSPEKIKRQIILLATLIVGSSVALVGVIGFVGLVVPYIARVLVGADHRRLMPLTIVLGGLLLTIADIASKSVIQATDLPVGLLSGALGAPFFIVLLINARKRTIF